MCSRAIVGLQRRDVAGKHFDATEEFTVQVDKTHLGFGQVIEQLAAAVDPSRFRIAGFSCLLGRILRVTFRKKLGLDASTAACIASTRLAVGSSPRDDNAMVTSSGKS
ncbi:hypothetical protein WK77_16235 [Burkholderia ubonensis]|nr:hypothetical protein WK77_16235 [Burkholderia ubonensis]